MAKDGKKGKDIDIKIRVQLGIDFIDSHSYDECVRAVRHELGDVWHGLEQQVFGKIREIKGEGGAKKWEN